jgi:hypothetical protein
MENILKNGKFGEKFKTSTWRTQDRKHFSGEPLADDKITPEKMMEAIKEMDKTLTSRKRSHRTGDLTLLALIIAMGTFTSGFFLHIIFKGQWVPLSLCQRQDEDIKKIPQFCFSCYGPSPNDWLWCLDDK